MAAFSCTAQRSRKKPPRTCRAAQTAAVGGRPLLLYEASIRPSVPLSRDGSRRKWYILRTRLAKQFLKPGTERRDTIPEESSLSCNDIGLGIGWLTTDKWSVTALIEPFGQATRTFIAERRGVEEARVFAKWSPRGCRRVIFAPKSPCARWWWSVGGASGKYLEYPQHLSNRPKEGKKRDAFPTSR